MSTEKKKPSNPSAFPDPMRANASMYNLQEGMTLRDYFAAKAMQAEYLQSNGMISGPKWAERVAKDSYELADAMLKQREL